MSTISKFKGLSRPEQLSILFYIILGALLLAVMPFSGFAPHLALIGVFSLVTGVAVLLIRKLMVWFVTVQFIAAEVFALWTLFSIGASNWLITAGLAGYAVLTLTATLSLTIWRKSNII